MFGIASVACGALGLAATEARAVEPALTWNQRLAPTNVFLNAVTFGAGRFVAVSDRSGWVLTSDDGSTWGAHASGMTKDMYGVAHGNGVFAAIGAGGKAMTSPDGETWTPQETGTTANFNSLQFLNGLFVAMGDRGAILSSPNGVTWTPHNTATSNYWSDSTFANGQYVAVGYDYKTAEAISGVSSDLRQWTVVATGYTRYLDSVQFVGDRFYGVGYAGIMQTSADGLVWTTPANINGNWLFSLAYGNGTFVAVGEGGATSVSPDGSTWTRLKPLSRISLRRVAFGYDTFVAVGDKGVILQSNPVGSHPGGLVLSRPRRSGSQFEFDLTGEAGQTYEVQTTTDFKTWNRVGDVTCSASPTTCTLDEQTHPFRSYRVVKR